MNPYLTSLLAAARREELLADAVRHRPYPRQARVNTMRTGRLNRGAIAMRAWIDAAQL